MKKVHFLALCVIAIINFGCKEDVSNFTFDFYGYVNQKGLGNEYLIDQESFRINNLSNKGSDHTDENGMFQFRNQPTGDLVLEIEVEDRRYYWKKRYIGDGIVNQRFDIYSPVPFKIKSEGIKLYEEETNFILEFDQHQLVSTIDGSDLSQGTFALTLYIQDDPSVSNSNYSFSERYLFSPNGATVRAWFSNLEYYFPNKPETLYLVCYIANYYEQYPMLYAEDLKTRVRTSEVITTPVMDVAFK